jgi:hypothetical protein
MSDDNNELCCANCGKDEESSGGGQSRVADLASPITQKSMQETGEVFANV